MSSFSIHDCKQIHVEQHMPDNANCITLAISHDVFGADADNAYRRVSEKSTITLYRLPTEVTDILLEHFGNPNEASEEAA